MFCSYCVIKRQHNHNQEWFKGSSVKPASVISVFNTVPEMITDLELKLKTNITSTNYYKV